MKELLIGMIVLDRWKLLIAQCIEKNMSCLFPATDADIIQFSAVHGDNKFNICIIPAADHSERKTVLGGKASACRGTKRSFLTVLSMA